MHNSFDKYLTIATMTSLLFACNNGDSPASQDLGGKSVDTQGSGQFDLAPRHVDLGQSDAKQSDAAGPGSCCGNPLQNIGGAPTSYLAPVPTRSLAAQKAGGVEIKNTTCIDLKKFYLTQGPQTQFTAKVKQVLGKITATSRPMIIDAILKLLKDKSVFPCTPAQKKALSYNEASKKYPDKVKRSRTVDQIIKGGCLTGCTDHALVFATLARAKGIPATVTETISEKWIYGMVQKNKWDPAKQGHFYSAVFLGGKWVVFDPTKGKESPRSDSGYYTLNGQKNLLFARGLDSWDYGIRTMDEFSKQVKERFYIEGAQPK